MAQEYFACGGYELEQMTHMEAPWNQARANLLIDEPSHEIIRQEWMKEFYGTKAEANQ